MGRTGTDWGGLGRTDLVGERGLPIPIKRPREPKVPQLGEAAVVDQHVAALDVPVEDLLGVAVHEAAKQLLDDAFDLRRAEFGVGPVCRGARG